jgi:hypothetical protein
LALFSPQRGETRSAGAGESAPSANEKTSGNAASLAKQQARANQVERLDIEILWLGSDRRSGGDELSQWLWLSSRALVGSRLFAGRYSTAALVLPAHLQGEAPGLRAAMSELDAMLSPEKFESARAGTPSLSPQNWSQEIVAAWAPGVALLDDAMFVVEGPRYRVLWVGTGCQECVFVHRKEVLLAARGVASPRIAELANDDAQLAPHGTSTDAVRNWEGWGQRLRATWPSQIAIRSAISLRRRPGRPGPEIAEIQAASQDALTEVLRVQAWHELEHEATLDAGRAWSLFAANEPIAAHEKAQRSRETFERHRQFVDHSAYWRARYALALALVRPPARAQSKESILNALRSAPRALEIRILAAQVAIALGEPSLARRHMAIAQAYCNASGEMLSALAGELGMSAWLGTDAAPAPDLDAETSSAKGDDGSEGQPPSNTAGEVAPAPHPEADSPPEGSTAEP